MLTNPPFGKKSSYTVVGEDGDIERESQVYERDDFIATTSNKQLNFLQHVMSILKTPGTAAVVLSERRTRRLARAGSAEEPAAPHGH